MKVMRIGHAVAVVFLIMLCAFGSPVYGETSDVTVVFAFPRAIQRLNPWDARDPMHSAVMDHIFDRLVRLNAHGELEPCLAVSWESSSDAKTWVFHLRKGVRFTDGTPLTAQAVKEVFEIGISQEGAYGSVRQMLQEVEKIVALDEYTLQFKLSTAVGYFPRKLAAQYTEIISPTALKRLDAAGLAQHPVGTGPFMLKEWVPGVRLVMVRNPHYWGNKPKIDTIVFKEVLEDSARAIGLETGEIDIAYEVEPNTALRLRSNPNLEVKSVLTWRAIFIGMNNQKPPFNDVRVRRALNYAIDREGIVEGLLRGFGQVADAPVAPTIFGYNAQKPYGYDPKRARSLLAEAGYPNGIDVPFWVPIGEVGEGVGEALAAQMAEAGIRAKIENMELARFRELRSLPVEKAPQRLVLRTFSAYAGVEDDVLQATLVKSAWAPARLNDSFYSNPKVEELLNLARATPDEAKQKALYTQVNAIIWDDAPQAWVYYKPHTLAYDRRLRGVEVPMNELVNLRNAWVER